MTIINKLTAVLLLGAGLILSSCSELEYQPLDARTSDAAISDAISANAAVLGAYSEMQDATLTFDGYLASSQYFSDEAIWTGTFPTRAEFSAFGVFPENATMAAMFSDYYDCVNTCNTVLASMDVVVDPALEQGTPTLRTVYQAELRFIRAFNYWYLANGWGNVPVVLDPTTPDGTDGATLNVPNNTKQEVYDQIEADLLFAEANLPATNAGGQRATADAAKMMLARLYLFEGDYDQALAFSEEIINSGTYSLETSFAAVFGEERGNSEQIWYLTFTELDGNSNSFFYYPSSLGGRLSISPSPELIAAYDTTDVRLGVTVVGSYGNKYQDVGTGTDPLYFCRYGEVLLIAAEAAAETGDLAKATGYLNQIRTRAGLEDATLTADNYVDMILTEKFKELALEGPYRLWDLRRRGLAESVLGPLGYTPGTDELWPIPQRDLDRNPNLNQNPGY